MATVGPENQRHDEEIANILKHSYSASTISVACTQQNPRAQSPSAAKSSPREGKVGGPNDLNQTSYESSRTGSGDIDLSFPFMKYDDPKADSQKLVILDQTDIVPNADELHLAVLGCANGAESAFIQPVLNGDKTSFPPFPAKYVSQDGVIFLLRFIEVDLEDMRVDAEHDIQWPPSVQQAKSSIDGAFLFWDIRKRGSICEITDILSFNEM